MSINNFTRTKEYLICVDSDGCAMDTMDIKHKKCFGPCLVDEWELNDYRKQVLEKWNELNLYSKTRGINRFKGLALMLDYVNANFKRIDGIEELKEWANTSPELSNTALQKVLNKNDIFKKALSWSVNLNLEIDKLTDDEKVAFKGVKEALEYAHKYCDVAIVSSANRKAVEEEWVRCGLLQHTDVILTQENGSKKACIAEILKFGYPVDKVLMVGDAVGDIEAAKSNGVCFYPILVKAENKSWARFLKEGIDKFLNGEYRGQYSEELEKGFYNNFE